MQRLDEGTPRAWELSAWLPWLLFAAISSVALGAAVALYHQENAHYEAHFELAMTERTDLLKMGIHLSFRPVQHMATLVAASEGTMSEREFSHLAQSIPLAQQPWVLALQWLPRERSASGQEIFPVRYSYGARADRNEDAVPRRVVARARQRRHLYVSPWYLQDGEVRYRALRPVFKSVRGERELIGFVSGLYRADRLLAAALCPPEGNAIRLFVSDPAAATAGSLYCVGRRASVVVRPSLGSGLKLTRSVGIEGGHWRVTAVAEPGAFTASRWPPLVIGIGGIVLGGVLAIFQRSLIGREQGVRRLVRRRTEQLQRRTEQLQATNTELEAFAFVASHDLKAPLRAVSQLASCIEDDAADRLDETSRARLRLLRERVIRMDGLIDGLLAYSRAGRVTDSVHAAVPLRPMLERLTRELPLPRGFRVQLEDPLPSLRADALHVRQVFQNLIINAFTHHDRPHSGAVWIRSEEEGRYWRLEVADDGPGIPAEQRERVFEMFTSLGGARDGHSGMGLALVRKVVSGYGGKVDLTENRPRGALFRIWWPK